MLRAERSLLVGRMSVLDVDEEQGIITVDHSLVLGTNPNRRGGMTFQNEAGTVTWRGEFLDGRWRKGECRYRLTGAPVRRADLTDDNDDGRVSVVVWDVGVGDVLRSPVHVNIERTAPGEYLVRSDTDATVTVAGGAVLRFE